MPPEAPLDRTGSIPGLRRNRPVVLVGFQDQGNLGIGYLAAVLERAGHPVLILDIERPEAELVDAIREADPLLVGFSLIFQFYIRRYAALMAALRAAGLGCHFTMGGHYASLSWRQAMAAAPDLDSIVRFEGEDTLLEMAEVIAEGRDWRGIAGLVTRDAAGGAVANPPRALVEDLDRLPWPERRFTPETVLGRRAMPLLASRGCARTCSFCSIHTFYRTAPGKVVRTRKPAEVVREMAWLHEAQGITIFLFQDDDFPLFGRKWRAWAEEMVAELHRAGLVGRVIWKINCRADVVEPEIFQRMRDAGLYLVYMGLESGTEEGLRTLNKEITVAQNLEAVRILKSHGLLFEFGFMMFDPGSSFASIRGNLGFLRAIVGDGSAAAIFCKMLPYDGTPIKDALEAAGRLKGDVVAPDYDFLDPRMDAYYAALTRMVDRTGWIHGTAALTPRLNWAWNELAILRALFPALPGAEAYRAALAKLTAEANARLFVAAEALALRHETGRGRVPAEDSLRRHAEAAAGRLMRLRDGFIRRNAATLMAALEREAAVAA